MVRWSTIVRALYEPLAIVATGVLIVWLVLSNQASPLVLATIATVWLVGLIVRHILRRRRLGTLLASPPQKMAVIALDDFSTHAHTNCLPGSQAVSAGGPTDTDLASLLHKRRLVLLCGDRLCGRSIRAYETLQSHFSDYIVLRPAWPLGTGTAPLTKLLTSGVSLRKRYILWLEDIDILLDFGLDPRIIERWLAGGFERVAIGTITPHDRDRILAARTQSSESLQRAEFVPVSLPLHFPGLGAVRAAYRHAFRTDPNRARHMRVVAAFELLGITAPTREQVHRALESLNGHGIDDDIITSLCTGDPAPLYQHSDGRLSPHAELLTTVDDEIPEHLDAALISALSGALEPPGLLILGQSLAARGHLDAWLILRLSSPFGGETSVAVPWNLLLRGGFVAV